MLCFLVDLAANAVYCAFFYFLLSAGVKMTGVGTAPQFVKCDGIEVCVPHV